MEVIIVIPVYKNEPSAEECASFRQCLRVLGRYDIAFVTYEGLDCSAYKEIAEQEEVEGIKIELFERDFFKSVFDYNRLCLNPSFYKRFANYKYMLIYQLDAWVFRDELEEWCDKGYDYIGAPWVIRNHKSESYKVMKIVGNGGFSLRKISFCIDVLTKKKHLPILTPKGILKMSNKSWMDYLKFPLQVIGIRNNVATFVGGKNKKRFLDEDLLFARFKYSYRKFSIPGPDEAMKFAFETHPSYLFQLNNGKLPFGCHGYKKQEYKEFWCRYIKEDGVQKEKCN